MCGLKFIRFILVTVVVLLKVRSCELLDQRKIISQDAQYGNDSSVQIMSPEEVSCNFDSMHCVWSAGDSSALHFTRQQFGVTENYSWFASTYWYHRNKPDFKKTNSYDGWLSLVIHMIFIPKRMTATYVGNFDLPVTDSYDYVQDWTTSASTSAFPRPTSSSTTRSRLPSNVGTTAAALDISQTKPNAFKVNIHEFRSPWFRLKTEGCVTFKLRGFFGMSSSDSLELWAEKRGQGQSLLWSHYDQIWWTWKTYYVGLSAGVYRMHFNGSSYHEHFRKKIFKFHTSANKQLYDIDDIQVLLDTCRPSSPHKRVYHSNYTVGNSLYSNTKCRWIGTNLSESPEIRLDLITPNSTKRDVFAVTTTHVTRSGFNVCVRKKSGNDVGWKGRGMKVRWYVNDEDGKPTNTSHPSEHDVTAAMETAMSGRRLVAMPTTHKMSVYCADKFECRSLECVPLEQVCDGVTDCVTGDDEDQDCDNRSKESGRFSIIFLASLVGLAVLLLVFSCVRYARLHHRHRLSLNSSDVQRLLPKTYKTLVEHETENEQPTLPRENTSAVITVD